MHTPQDGTAVFGRLNRWQKRSWFARVLCVLAVAQLMIPQMLPLVALAAEVKAAAETKAPDAAAATNPSPIGFLGIGFEANDEEFRGTGNALLPIWASSSGKGLVFGDLRVSAGDNQEQEVNVGLGLRRLVNMKGQAAILGANIYYDSRWTAYDNQVNQLGLGLEFLSKWADARFNYYLPETSKMLADSYNKTETTTRSESTLLSNASADDLTLANHQIYQPVTYSQSRLTTTYNTTTTTHYEWFEAALKGFDAEVGVRLPYVEKYADTRVFVGYQQFDNPFGDDYKGMKGRIEVRAMPGLTLDAQYFEDKDLNSGNYYVGARMYVPFDVRGLAAGKNPFKGAADNFNKRAVAQDVSKRLAEPVMRDVKVRTQFSPVESQIVSSSTTTTTTEEIISVSHDDLVILDDVQFVSNVAGAVGNAGTAGESLDTIQHAIDTAFGDKNVYVFGTGTPYDSTHGGGSVIVSNGVSVYGSTASFVGLGGRTYTVPGATKPTIVGDGVTATFTMGDNTTVAGFLIKSSPTAGGTDLIPSPNGWGTWDASRAGIKAVNKTGLTISQNTFADVSYGAIIVNNMTLPDPKDTLVANISGNAFNHAEENGLVIDVEGNGGLVTPPTGALAVNLINNEFSYNLGDYGLLFDAEDYPTSTLIVNGATAVGNNGVGMYMYNWSLAGDAIVSLANVTATGNYSTNIEVYNYAYDGNATVAMANVDASRSTWEYGIYIDNYSYDDNGDGISGDAVVTMNNVVANLNYSTNIYIDNWSEEGNSVVSLQNIVACDSQWGYGVYVDNWAEDSDGDGVAGDAIVRLNGITANGNYYTNLYVYNYADEGNATVDLANVAASGSVYYYGIYIDNIVDDSNGDGVAGDAIVTLTNVVANHSYSTNIYIDNYSYEGDATVSLAFVTADSSIWYDGIYIDNYAYDNDGDGTSGNALVTLNNVTATGNYSTNIYIDNYSDEGNAVVALANVNANNSVWELGLEIDNEAYNNGDGTGGYALVSLTGVTANNNYYTGINIYNYAYEGDAIISMVNVVANNSVDDHGMYIYNGAYDDNGDGVGGDAVVTMNNVVASGNYSTNIYITDNESYEGSAIIVMDNVTASGCFDGEGIHLHNYAYDDNSDGVGGDAIVTMSNIVALENYSTNIDICSNDSYEGNAVVTLNNIQASGSLDGYGVYISNYAYDMNSDGQGGDAIVSVMDVTASNNYYSNMEIYNSSYEGDAIVSLVNVVASGSRDYEGIYINNSAYDDNSDGIGGDAIVTLTNVISNDSYSTNISIYNDSYEGLAQVSLETVTANTSDWDYGIYIDNSAYDENGDGIGGSAVVSFNNVTACYSYYTNFEIYNESYEGDAIVTIANSVANGSTDDYGIYVDNYARDMNNDGVGGDAIVSLNNVSASNNYYTNIDIYNYADEGDAVVSLNGVTASRARDEYGIYIYNLAYDHDGDGMGGDAIVSLVNVVASYNYYTNIYINNYSYGADAVVSLTNVQASNCLDDNGVTVYNYAYDGDGDGVSGDALVTFTGVTASSNYSTNIYIDNESDEGLAQVTLDTVTAGQSRDGYGIYVYNYAYDSNSDGSGGDAIVYLNNVVANYNYYSNIDIYNYGYEGSAQVILNNVTADYSRSDYGIYVGNYAYDNNNDGVGGDAIVSLTNVAASYNYSTNIYIDNYSEEGSAQVSLSNVIANNSIWYYGVDIDNSAYDHNADGVGGDAVVSLVGVTANGNYSTNIYIDNESYEGLAQVALDTVSGNASREGYGIEIGNYAYDMNNDGVGGDAIMALTGVTANDNYYSNLYLYNYSYEGLAQVALNTVSANGSRYYYGIELYNSAYDNNADGVGGDAVVSMNGVTANANYSTNIYIDNESYEGDAAVTLSDVAANMSTYYSGIYVYNRARDNNVDAAGGDATVTMNNVHATYNSDDYGVYIDMVATAGTASVDVANSVMTNNGNDGLAIDVTGVAVDLNVGNATLATAGYNSFQDNGGVGVGNYGSGTVSAENNYWGTVVVDPVTDGYTSGSVDASPWLTTDPNP